jgi:hypothetical protein
MNALRKIPIPHMVAGDQGKKITWQSPQSKLKLIIILKN